MSESNGKLSMKGCVNKSAPLTSPCDCASICRAKYGVEVRKIRAAIYDIPQKDHEAREKAINRWQAFIAQHAPKL